LSWANQRLLLNVKVSGLVLGPMFTSVETTARLKVKMLFTTVLLEHSVKV